MVAGYFRTKCGGLTIGRRDNPDVAAVRSCAEERGLEHEILAADAARERFPQHRLDDDEIMVLDPAAGVLRPEPSVQAALRAAERAGASVLPYHSADEVVETNGGWRIVSDDRRFDVDHVVFAAGPWAPGLEPLRELPVQSRQITACWFAAHDPWN